MTRRNKLIIYDAANAEVARIIIADPAKHAGIQLEWARAWSQRKDSARTEGAAIGRK